MMNEIIQLFWLFLPAGLANMAPVLFKKVPFLNIPISKKYLGKNKTWRGIFFGIILAIIIVWIQSLLAIDPKYQLVNYAQTNRYLLGFLLGLGALVGDSVESFFKRRQGIAPGKPWPFFDQTDWIIGAVIFVNFYVAIGLGMSIGAIVLFGLLHVAVKFISYSLRIDKEKF